MTAMLTVLVLQLEGAVKGENGFAADDVLRLNRAGRPPLPSIAEDQASASAPGWSASLRDDAAESCRAPIHDCKRLPCHMLKLLLMLRTAATWSLESEKMNTKKSHNRNSKTRPPVPHAHVGPQGRSVPRHITISLYLILQSLISCACTWA